MKGALHVLEALLDLLEIQKHRWRAAKHLEVVKAPIQGLRRTALAEVLSPAHRRAALPAGSGAVDAAGAGAAAAAAAAAIVDVTFVDGTLAWRSSCQESPAEGALETSVRGESNQAIGSNASLTAAPKNRVLLPWLRLS